MPLRDFVRENIRREIEKQGWTQRALSAEMGMHYVTLNKILQGKLEPSFEVCENIARALQVPVQNFFQEPVDVVSRIG